MPGRPISPPRFRRYVIPIVLVWLASAAFRWWHFDERRITSNIDASYHVLLTVRALDATPASTHHFLPIVSLGRPLDRDVPFATGRVAVIPGTAPRRARLRPAPSETMSEAPLRTGSK